MERSCSLWEADTVRAPTSSDNVVPGSTISTDGQSSYGELHHRYVHGVVAHTDKEYVRGIHHTNTVEGHCSHFERAIAGTHVNISGKHLWKYAAEFNYCRNYRASHTMMFNHLVAAFSLPVPAES